MDVEWGLVLMDLRLNTLDFLKPAASETGSKEKSLINYLSFLIWDEPKISAAIYLSHNWNGQSLLPADLRESHKKHFEDFVLNCG